MYRLWGGTDTEESHPPGPLATPSSTAAAWAVDTHRGAMSTLAPRPMAERSESQRQYSVALLRQKAYDSHRDALEQQLRTAKLEAAERKCKGEELLAQMEAEREAARARAAELQGKLSEAEAAVQAEKRASAAALQRAKETAEKKLIDKRVRACAS